MRSLITVLCCLTVFAGAISAQGQSDSNSAAAESAEQGGERRSVTAVYGVTADDYLPESPSADDYLRPKVRRAASRPSFDLPDAFYFIGGPIFVLIFLRVLVIFLNGFEEKRKEEENQVASEHFNPD